PLRAAQAQPAEPDACPARRLAGGNRYGLVGASEAMRQVYRLIGKVLHVPIAVLIQGETGTGKELVARAIHEHGSRRSKPFVVQNCAALPENLLESELRSEEHTSELQSRENLVCRLL